MMGLTHSKQTVPANLSSIHICMEWTGLDLYDVEEQQEYIVQCYCQFEDDGLKSI